MDHQSALKKEKTSRFTWVDFMRSAGIFLVVLAHIDIWDTRIDWIQTIYFTISRNGVPIFFMLSGYLLLSKEEDILTFFKKRAAKIIIPFFVWSIIYDIYFSNSFGDVFTLNAVLKMLLRILRGPRAGHFWFFYALIGLYFFTPILRVFVAKAKKSDIIYYLSLWFITIPVFFILEQFTPLKNGFELYYFTGYVGYFLLGIYLGRMQTTPYLMRIALGLIIIGAVSTFAVYYLNLPPIDNKLPFRSYQSLNIILMTIGAFILLKATGERMRPSLAHFSEKVSRSSFGIYLIHPIILIWMSSGWEALGYSTSTGPSIVIIPFVAVIAFLLSWGITFVMRKIPLLRIIVP